VIRNFKVREEKIVVIPNGINPEEFRRLKRKKNDGRVVLYVGRLEKYKVVDYLIKVLPRLDEDIRLEIIRKGPYKWKLLKLIDELRVANRVKFHQDLPRNELLQKYATASVFVTLSKYEAFNISTMEALASGTPCIVANTSALSEWIDNKMCFGIDYPINEAKLAELIMDVIKTRKNVNQYLKLLSWDEVVDKIAQLYA